MAVLRNPVTGASVEPGFRLTQRLYVDATKSRVCAESDPDAAFMLGIPGDEIPVSLARRLGLLVDPDAADEGEPEEKERKKKPSTKIVKPAETKGA